MPIDLRNTRPRFQLFSYDDEFKDLNKCKMTLRLYKYVCKYVGRVD